MLTEGDHALLESLRGRHQSLKAALAEAELTATAAREQFERSRQGTGLRERLFWWSGPAARAHAESRYARDKARAAVAEQRRRLRRFVGGLDGELGPVMARFDPRYPALRQARTDCERAMREVRAAREAFEALEFTARRIVRARHDKEVRPEVASARNRYRHQVRRARDSARSAAAAVERARRSLGEAGLPVPSVARVEVAAPRQMPDSAGDDRSVRMLRGRVGALTDAAGRLRRLHRELAAVPEAAGVQERRIRERAREQVVGGPGSG